MGFDLKSYEPVEDRLRRFWSEHPDGRVITELVHHDGQRYVFRAEVYTDRDDHRPAATGYAEEHVTAKGVNSTNAIENCETSAAGRALANLNYAPKGARPSQEEMAKANRREEASEADKLRQQIRSYCDESGIEPSAAAEDFSTQFGGDIRTAEADSLSTYLEVLKANGIGEAA